MRPLPYYRTRIFYEPYVAHARTFFSIPSDVVITIKIITSGNRMGYTQQHNDKVYILAIHKDIDHIYALETILHELKHIEQFVLGRLAYNDEDTTEESVLWEGKKYALLDVSYDVNNRAHAAMYQAYCQQPWEVEAFEMQKHCLRVFSHDPYICTPRPKI